MLGNSDLDGIQPFDDTTTSIIVCDPGSSSNDYTIKKIKRRGCLMDINVTRAKHMTPKKINIFTKKLLLT